MAIIYDTVSRHRADRFRFWSSLMCRTFAPAEGSAIDADAFDASFTVSELGAATVCKVSAPRQSWERSAQHVRRAPRDEFLFTQVLSGRGTLRQCGRELVLTPGTMSLYDTSRPYSYEVGGEVLFVKLPRRQLLEQIAEPRQLAVALDADAGLADWTAGIVRHAAELEPLANPQSAERVGHTVLSAIAALLSSTPTVAEAPGVASDAGLLDRICQQISTRLGDPSLSLSSIAQMQGLSERTLNRLFAQRGTTPMKWVLQQRLSRSLQVLQHDAAARVTDVAFAHGFNDLSHFSRVFKKTYAISPHQAQTGDQIVPPPR